MPSFTTKDQRIGKRVEIAPHYDLWMRGARFGTVKRVYLGDSVNPRERLAIRMDHPQVKRLATVYADDVTYL
jgi:hypothetical protein